MYTTAKRLSIFCFILAVINIAFTLFYLLLLKQQMLNFTEMFIRCCYLGSSTLVLILLTIATRSICSDLEMEYDSRSRQIKGMEDHIKELESKIKNLENNA